MDTTVRHLSMWQELSTDTARSQQGAPCPFNALGVGVWAEFSRIVLLSQPALTIFHRHLIITREDTSVSRTVFAWCLISSQEGSNSSSWTTAIYRSLIQFTINTTSFKLLAWNPEWWPKWLYQTTSSSVRDQQEQGCSMREGEPEGKAAQPGCACTGGHSSTVPAHSRQSWGLVTGSMKSPRPGEGMSHGQKGRVEATDEDAQGH